MKVPGGQFVRDRRVWRKRYENLRPSFPIRKKIHISTGRCAPSRAGRPVGMWSFFRSSLATRRNRVNRRSWAAVALGELVRGAARLDGEGLREPGWAGWQVRGGSRSRLSIPKGCSMCGSVEPAFQGAVWFSPEGRFPGRMPDVLPVAFLGAVAGVLLSQAD